MSSNWTVNHKGYGAFNTTNVYKHSKRTQAKYPKITQPYEFYELFKGDLKPSSPVPGKLDYLQMKDSRASNWNLMKLDGQLNAQGSAADFRSELDQSFLTSLDTKMNDLFSYKTGSEGPASSYINSCLAQAQDLFNNYRDYLLDLKSFFDYQLVYDAALNAYNILCILYDLKYNEFTEKKKEYDDELINYNNAIAEIDRINAKIASQNGGETLDDIFALQNAIAKRDAAKEAMDRLIDEISKLSAELEGMENDFILYDSILTKTDAVLNTITSDMGNLTLEMNNQFDTIIPYTDADLSKNDFAELIAFADFLNSNVGYTSDLAGAISNSYYNYNDFGKSLWNVSSTDPGSVLSNYIQRIEFFSRNYEQVLNKVESDSIGDLTEEERQLADKLIEIHESNNPVSSSPTDLPKELPIIDTSSAAALSVTPPEQIASMVTPDIIYTGYPIFHLPKSEENIIRSIENKYSMSREDAETVYNTYKDRLQNNE